MSTDNVSTFPGEVKTTRPETTFTVTYKKLDDTIVSMYIGFASVVGECFVIQGEDMIPQLIIPLTSFIEAVSSTVEIPLEGADEAPLH